MYIHFLSNYNASLCQVDIHNHVKLTIRLDLILPLRALGADL